MSQHFGAGWHGRHPQMSQQNTVLGLHQTPCWGCGPAGAILHSAAAMAGKMFCITNGAPLADGSWSPASRARLTQGLPSKLCQQSASSTYLVPGWADSTRGTSVMMLEVTMVSRACHQDMPAQAGAGRECWQQGCNA